jgi:hypothetical protein
MNHLKITNIDDLLLHQDLYYGTNPGNAARALIMNITAFALGRPQPLV